MAAAQQPPHPFTSGINIKLTLSSAFSTQLNPRNFEANYTPVWIATLCNACRFSNRLLVATEPYLSIPGKIINELKLKAKGEELSENDKTWMLHGRMMLQGICGVVALIS